MPKKELTQQAWDGVKKGLLRWLALAWHLGSEISEEFPAFPD